MRYAEGKVIQGEEVDMQIEIFLLVLLLQRPDKSCQKGEEDVDVHVDVHHPRKKRPPKIPTPKKKPNQTRPTPNDMQNEFKAMYSMKQ